MNSVHSAVIILCGSSFFTSLPKNLLLPCISAIASQTGIKPEYRIPLSLSAGQRIEIASRTVPTGIILIPSIFLQLFIFAFGSTTVSKPSRFASITRFST